MRNLDLLKPGKNESCGFLNRKNTKMLGTEKNLEFTNHFKFYTYFAWLKKI